MSKMSTIAPPNNAKSNSKGKESHVANLALCMLSKVETGCEAMALARLMGVPDKLMQRLVDRLAAEGRIIIDEYGRLCPQGIVLPLPLPFPKGLADIFSGPSLAVAFLCYHEGRYIEFFRMAFDVLRVCIGRGHPLSARRAYDIICRLLLDLQLSLDDRELCGAFLFYGQYIQEEMIHFPWKARHALTLCYKMRGVAFCLGDQRALGYLDMTIGYLNISLRSAGKSGFYQKVMVRGIAAIRQLGDSEALWKSQGIFCFYHFIEGEFAKAVNCAYPSLYLPDGQTGPFNPSLYFHSVLSAAHMGEFDVALDLLTLAEKQGRQSGHKQDTSNLRGLLPYIHLLRHNDEEALSIIDDIINNQHLSVLTYAELWASRTLAYYHYLQGNVLQSYACFKSWQQKNNASGIVHSNFIAASFVLELLAAYYLAGFPPPLEHTIHEELAWAMASPSRLLKVSALRLAAEVRAHEVGWNDEEAQSLLLKSLELVRTFTAPIETAKVLQSVVRSRLAKGENAGARAAATEARGIHLRYGQPPWPDEFADLVDTDGEKEVPLRLSPASIFANLFQSMRQQYDCESNEAFLHSLLGALLATLGMTAGQIFRVEDTGPVRLASVGVSAGVFAGAFEASSPAAELVSGENWAEISLQNMLKESREKRQAVLQRLDGDEGSSIRLSLFADAEEQGQYLLWLEGQPRRQIELALGEPLFSMLGDYLGTEICLHLRRSSMWHDYMRSVVSSATPRLAEAQPILFRTQCMRELLTRVDRLARKDATVLILGESGVGKELIARRLHELSARQGEFVPVNLASTPDELFESEFFGHEKGSFSGASYQKRGLFELADKGTLFIDEAGDIPPSLQVKLLRVLQEKRFLRVGGTRFLASDFRLIAATNRNLEEEVRAGRFREDLYYRLSVVPLQVPPLRERPEDVLFLAEHFLRFFASRHQIAFRDFTEHDKSMLLSYAWPGNVRELKNYVERSLLLPEQARFLPPASPVASTALAPGRPNTHSLAPATHEYACEICPPQNLFQEMPSLTTMQDTYFSYVYTQAQGMVGGPDGIAKILGISRTTAYAWIERLGLRDRFEKRLVARTSLNSTPG